MTAATTAAAATDQDVMSVGDSLRLIADWVDKHPGLTFYDLSLKSGDSRTIAALLDGDDDEMSTKKGGATYVTVGRRFGSLGVAAMAFDKRLMETTEVVTTEVAALSPTEIRTRLAAEAAR